MVYFYMRVLCKIWKYVYSWTTFIQNSGIIVLGKFEELLFLYFNLKLPDAPMHLEYLRVFAHWCTSEFLPFPKVYYV